MIENLCSEGIVCVANVTVLCCWNVASRLNKSGIGNKLADVTAFTATGDAGMNIAQEF